jgi:hypothetical protein
MSNEALFLRLLEDEDKGAALLETVRAVAAREPDRRVFEVAPTSFEQVPGAPFAYWVSERARNCFQSSPAVESQGRSARIGLSTSDDWRFVRLWWEVLAHTANVGEATVWRPFAKGGKHSSIYADVHLMISWNLDAAELKEWVVSNPTDPGTTHWSRRIANSEFFLRPGLTWPLRTQSGLALRVMPSGCNFGHKGPVLFVEGDSPKSLMALASVTNSSAFRTLISLHMAFGSYEVGVIQRTPIPELSNEDSAALARLARRSWALKRSIDSATLTSHAFTLYLV